MVLAVKLKVCPEHAGLINPAVGAAGIAFTVTETVPAGLVHPKSVAVTE